MVKKNVFLCFVFLWMIKKNSHLHKLPRLDNVRLNFNLHISCCFCFINVYV